MPASAALAITVTTMAVYRRIDIRKELARLDARRPGDSLSSICTRSGRGRVWIEPVRTGMAGRPVGLAFAIVVTSIIGAFVSDRLYQNNLRELFIVLGASYGFLVILNKRPYKPVGLACIVSIVFGVAHWFIERQSVLEAFGGTIRTVVVLGIMAGILILWLRREQADREPIRLVDQSPQGAVVNGATQFAPSALTLILGLQGLTAFFVLFLPFIVGASSLTADPSSMFGATPTSNEAVQEFAALTWSAAERWVGPREALEYRIGMEEYSRGRFDAAYHHASRALAFDRHSLRSLELFVASAELVNEDGPALTELEQRRAADELTPELRMRKAELLFETKRFSDAEAESVELLRAGTADAWEVLASSLIQLDACERLSQFSSLPTAGSPSARLAVGRCAIARGATDEALHVYEDIASRVGIGVVPAMSAKMHIEILSSSRLAVPKSGALIVALGQGEALLKGVRPRDILVGADGEAVLVAADVNRARVKRSSAPQIRWTVWRSGQLLEVITRPARLGIQLIDW